MLTIKREKDASLDENPESDKLSPVLLSTSMTAVVSATGLHQSNRPIQMDRQMALQDLFSLYSTVQWSRLNKYMTNQTILLRYHEHNVSIITLSIILLRYHEHNVSIITLSIISTLYRRYRGISNDSFRGGPPKWKSDADKETEVRVDKACRRGKYKQPLSRTPTAGVAST
ncbi:hypothetical protein J6590_035250 [Homalodisca vitripennis]|nr:hypothetical protein J6590_035250 [Homalodisca vitripennis]